MASDAPLHVTVLYSPAPRETLEWRVALPAGASALHALQASGLAQALPPSQWATAGIGVWGRKCTLEQVLREADRLEVYRPLQVDPKVARRERFRQQGTRGAGLFSRRKGAPPPA